MDKVLIDTDVVLDFFFDRQPFSNDASKILSFCERKQLKGYVTPVMISNIYYLLRKTAKHQKVISHIKSLLDILDVLTMNRAVVLEALEGDFTDFEDGLQNFSAQHEKGVNLIITRNVKDYKSSRLSVMTPEAYLKTR